VSTMDRTPRYAPSSVMVLGYGRVPVIGYRETHVGRRCAPHNGGTERGSANGIRSERVR
jgi:hypothetical protein